MPKTLSDAEQWQEYQAMEEEFHMLMRHMDFVTPRLQAIMDSLVPNQHFQQVDWSPQAVEMRNFGARPFTPGEKEDVS